ncbi:MAG: hypothetical protein WC315_00795 [Candidatus Omnitrophota bacterium]|jgi:hypothetical protein
MTFDQWWEENKEDCTYSELPTDVIKLIAMAAYDAGWEEGWDKGCIVPSIQ